MILNPGILALLFGGLLTFVVATGASLLGLHLVRHWNPLSSEEGQLKLERRAWLISSLMNLVLGYQIFSSLLFVYTLEDIHPLFVGAMCATGSLNANQSGWAALLVKLILLFLAAFWVWLNRLDLQTSTTPLVPFKYRSLLLLTPLLGLDFYLQYAYFSGLNPEIITSCCGSLFGLGSAGVASEMAALPAAPTMLAFYATVTLLLLLLCLCLWRKAAFYRFLLLVAALCFLLVALVSVVAFISVYIYQLPSHHCPFDMLQHHYLYIGYPLYISLFAASLLAMLPGLAIPLRRDPALELLIVTREKNWLRLALLLLIIFVLLVSWPILFGPFVLLGD